MHILKSKIIHAVYIYIYLICVYLKIYISSAIYHIINICHTNYQVRGRYLNIYSFSLCIQYIQSIVVGWAVADQGCVGAGLVTAIGNQSQFQIIRVQDVAASNAHVLQIAEIAIVCRRVANRVEVHHWRETVLRSIGLQCAKEIPVCQRTICGQNILLINTILKKKEGRRPPANLCSIVCRTQR